MTKAKWHDAKTERPPRPNLYLVCGTYLPTRTSGMMTCRWNGEKWEAAIQIRVTDWTPLPPPPSRDYIAFPGQSPCKGCRKKPTCTMVCTVKKDWDRSRTKKGKQKYDKNR
jgi:hypothetical protein